MKGRSLFPALAAAGTLAGLAGAVAPWIPHRAAGLNIGGFDLFEVSKFLPAVRSGVVPLWREAFLLPLLLSALLLALLPTWPALSRRLLRWLLPLLAAGVALGALPPYPAILNAHRDPEYRGQLLLAAGTLLLSLFSPLARRLPRRLLGAITALLAALGLFLPLWSFAHVYPLYARLYGAPPGVGWGVAVYVLGMLLVLASAAGRTRLRTSAGITEG